jgi:hypothetical protein
MFHEIENTKRSTEVNVKIMQKKMLLSQKGMDKDFSLL